MSETTKMTGNGYLYQLSMVMTAGWFMTLLCSYTHMILTSLTTVKPFHGIHIDLIGGFKPSEQYWSIGMMIPSIWENGKIQLMLQTTNQPLQIPNGFMEGNMP